MKPVYIIKAVRRDFAAGKTCSVIAAELGIGRSTVERIIRGEGCYAVVEALTPCERARRVPRARHTAEYDADAVGEIVLEPEAQARLNGLRFWIENVRDRLPEYRGT